MDAQLPQGFLAPFPKERFLTFVSRLKVLSKDEGLVPFKPLQTQTYILDEMVDGLSKGVSTFYILKARQIGCTTFFLALDLFWAFEHKGLLGTFILHKEEARDDWRQTIDVFYHEIPRTTEIDGEMMRFRPGLERHNRNLLAFKNGSRFRYLIAGTGAKKGGLGRSGASNYTHATEVAFYGNDDDLRAYRSQTSSIYAHRMTILESTANGFNHFHDMYKAGRDQPGVRCMFVGWWRDERNRFGIEHPLYKAYCPDRLTSNFERERIKIIRKQYGVDISLPQLAWYRWKLAEEFDGDESMFLQEFPWIDDDAFQATGAKYFTSESITAAIKAALASPFQGYRYSMGMRWEDTRVNAWKDHRAELRIWEQSSAHGYYVIGCDPAYGSSDSADRTVISVWRCYQECIVQVAEFCTNQASTYQCAWVLSHLAGFYGQLDVQVILEITGPGMAVWAEMNALKQRLNELRPETDEAGLRNVFKHMRGYMYRKADSLHGDLAHQWKMTEELKKYVMASFKDALELRIVIPRSVPLLEECRHIVNDEGHIEAEGSYKDDRVIAAALAYHAWQKWTYPILKAKRMTVERSQSIEASGGEKPLDIHIREYLCNAKINVDGPARVRQPWERPGIRVPR